MLKNYSKIAWRNLVKNKVQSFINIGGLAVGMSVTILLGLWIYDELSFNKNFENYDRLVAVMQHQTFNGDVGTQSAVPYLLGDELRKKYGSDFKYITMSSWTGDHILAFGEKKITQTGNYFEPVITDMLSLSMQKGTHAALRDDHSVILSASTAKALFGDADPMDKLIKIDNRFDVKVTGVYKDISTSSDFHDLAFIASWQLFINSNNWPEKSTNPWRSNSFQAFAQLNDNARIDQVSAKIKELKLKKVTPEDAAFKPVIFLHPMSRWHLYNKFTNGVNSGGRIEYVWLFAMIGLFVLLLACINFMNLSTARSEKRAKEVGIRKAIGSLRGQLIGQFFCESLLVALLAFVCSLLLVQLLLPFFNEMAGKKIGILWTSPLFWILGICFSIITGLIAGSYPAIYLSSFRPVKVLKGAFRVGRFASLPRKVLVVMQFSVSVILIIGTVVVFRQIQFAKNRPVGYTREGLIAMPMVTQDIHRHFDAISTELKNAGAVFSMSESSAPVTYVNEVDNGFEWPGKDPAVQGNFAAVFTSIDFGKTIGWSLKEGRDFSRDFATDSSAMVLNETAVKFMGLRKPVGETIRWDGKAFHVIGVIKDMVMESPYSPVFRTVFVLNNDAQDVVVARIHPNTNTRDAIAKISAVFRKYNPAQPFDYKFIDEQYARKFGDEERIGKLATFFSVLAIFISCLGLFGMASFMAEKRTKEIGVRKVLGATVFNLWGLLSKDFVVLVLVSLLIATPVSYYCMHNWLLKYEYRAGIPWWIFVAAGAGALLITMLTVSYQSIKAAVRNPVKSLRTE